jgi:hypothetical protein
MQSTKHAQANKAQANAKKRKALLIKSQCTLSWKNRRKEAESFIEE